jgi:hypothetical protein
MTRITLTAVLALAATLLFPGAAQAQSHSLRIMTYNVQMLPASPGQLSGSNDAYPVYGDNKARATYIGTKIREMNPPPDVIVLNEVFESGAAAHFVKALSDNGPYDYYVEYLGGYNGDGSIDPSDSGLMLFSRWPFAKFPAGHTGDYNGSSYDAENQGWPFEVLFHEFGGCTGNDCFAAKGAGMVRIHNTDTGTYFNVVFTHLNANDDNSPDEWTDGYWARRKNMSSIARMIGSALTPQQLEDELLFVLGDLNINGNEAGPAGGNLPGLPYREWEAFYSPGEMDGTLLDFFKAGNDSANNFPCPTFGHCMHDAWHEETLATDRGETAGRGGPRFGNGTGQRLDYVLRNWPPVPFDQPSCTQHVMKPWIFFYGPDGTAAPSDHLPLLIDMNIAAPHCNPQQAAPLSGFAANNDQHVPGNIDHPGNVQWYVIDDKGTFGIGTTTTSAQYAAGVKVYHHTDLSTPLVPYEKEYDPERQVWKYKLDSPPYYLKVQLKDATANRYDTEQYDGPYTLHVHKYDCTVWEEACALSPVESQEQIFPAQMFGPDETMWFYFFSDTSDLGKSPLLRFYIQKGTQWDEDLAVQLWREVKEGDAPKKVPWSKKPTWPNGQKMSTTGEKNLSKGKHYLSVKRLAFGYPVQTVRVRFTTELTFFFPRELICYDVQDDNNGDVANSHDELYMFVDKDGSPGETPFSFSLYDYKTDMPDDPGRLNGSAITMYRGKILEQVVVNMFDEDDTSNHDRLAASASSGVAIERLDELATGWNYKDDRPGHFVHKFGGDNAGYWYELSYQVSHEEHAQSQSTGNDPWN